MGTAFVVAVRTVVEYVHPCEFRQIGRVLSLRENDAKCGVGHDLYRRGRVGKSWRKLLQQKTGLTCVFAQVLINYESVNSGTYFMY
jgi:hypothetical protein